MREQLSALFWLWFSRFGLLVEVMRMLFPVAVAVAIRTFHVNAAILVYAEVLGGIECFKLKCMEPLHRLASGPWVQRLEFGF